MSAINLVDAVHPLSFGTRRVTTFHAWHYAFSRRWSGCHIS